MLRQCYNNIMILFRQCCDNVMIVLWRCFDNAVTMLWPCCDNVFTMFPTTLWQYNNIIATVTKMGWQCIDTWQIDTVVTMSWKCYQFSFKSWYTVFDVIYFYVRVVLCIYFSAINILRLDYVNTMVGIVDYGPVDVRSTSLSITAAEVTTEQL